jgi:bla regulator protein blaR1
MDKEIIAVQEQGKAFVAPPTPPTPPNPVDHILAMAKKRAVFFFEGEEISSNKALKIVKEQKNLNIQSKHTNGAPPEVRLTKTFQ